MVNAVITILEPLLLVSSFATTYLNYYKFWPRHLTLKTSCAKGSACRNYSHVCLFLHARVEITRACVYFCAHVQKLLASVFRTARACGFCSWLCHFVRAVL